MPFISISDYTIFRAFTKHIIWIERTFILCRRDPHIMRNCSNTAFRRHIVIEENTVIINCATVIGYFVIRIGLTIGQSNRKVVLQFGPFLSYIEVKCFVAGYSVIILPICPVPNNRVLRLVFNQNSIDSFSVFNCF